ncbi:MAG: AAA family ATPase, partial [Lachnospiraceae bacterium]|nr:AAA family ATPase [Lachnospiraceae bacterium]
MEEIKINRLEIENVKRIKAVKLTPTASGLTIIGGNNGQGKTSVLDSIAWALGGEKYRPSRAQREDSVLPPALHIILSNGLVVERKGKNSSLTVTDPQGNRAGQQLLNDFIEQLALDLPRFLSATPREKAGTLLKIIGVGDELAELERREKEVYSERVTIGRIADQKEKYAKEQPYYPDAPGKPVSAAELIRRQQEILAKNGENQRKRENLSALLRTQALLQREIEAQEARLSELREKHTQTEADIRIAETDTLDLQDQSTEELERDIEQIEQINRRVRANLDKDKAEEDARDYAAQYDALTIQLEDIRKEKRALLDSADLPYPGLSVEDGELLYRGSRWDCMSGAEQLKVATAIVHRLKPECGFVLLDGLEQMDLGTLEEFGRWLEQENLQAIAARVSTGGGCAIMIEDGYAVEPQAEAAPA